MMVIVAHNSLLFYGLQDSPCIPKIPPLQPISAYKELCLIGFSRKLKKTSGAMYKTLLYEKIKTKTITGSPFYIYPFLLLLCKEKLCVH